MAPARPPQQQDPPGGTKAMDPRPRDTVDDYEGRGLLDGRRALITGADSGIGRAVAIAFAKEGADLAIAYLDEHQDAAPQWPVDKPEELTDEQWLHTFDVNVHSCFRVTATALPHLGDSAAIINTGSVNGLRGNKCSSPRIGSPRIAATKSSRPSAAKRSRAERGAAKPEEVQ
ncbi:hypothetical protein GCM10022222_04110 [Amycolatopsis ultiminotia]|uniref:Short chain dehydrogenase n=1 Tax=Amycolatopsis ultiminotia TaxID=543629 RepID=A0ABP6V0F4_9PSEU